MINVVGYMLLMWIHEFEGDTCVVVIKLLCLMSFCENGSQMEKFDFGEFEWIDNVVVMN